MSLGVSSYRVAALRIERWLKILLYELGQGCCINTYAGVLVFLEPVQPQQRHGLQDAEVWSGALCGLLTAERK